MDTFQWIFAISLFLYLAVMIAVSIWAQRKIGDHEDYLVAGRRLPLSLAWATLLATWYGAGTLLTQANEVHSAGLQRAALDPLGPAVCLILAGLFFAGPLWKMRLLTLPDFFRDKFGPSSEVLASLIMVPSYFGWVAAQIVALAMLITSFFPLDFNFMMIVVAVVGTGYTLMGGMWSVTLTDALQISLVLLGLVVLGFITFTHFGDGAAVDGWNHVWENTPASHQILIPTETLAVFMIWFGVFLAGALGNIPGQDLTQRIFAAKSAGVARNACLISGVLYLIFGFLPLLLGLAGRLIFPDLSEDESIVPLLAHDMLTSPWVLTIFMLAIVSAVLSTIDSAILSPASVLSENVVAKITKGTISPLTLNRAAVVFVAVASLIFAFVGESAYVLLENAYQMPMVGLFVPLTLGIYMKPRGPWPANAAMMAGFGIWAVHFVMDWEFFLDVIYVDAAVASTLIALVVYLVVHYSVGKRATESVQI